MVKALMMTLVLLLGAGQTSAKVKKFLRETVAIYDQDGKPMGRVDKWSLPNGGAVILGTNANGQVGIRGPDGKTVYLRSSEILTEGETARCAQVGQGARAAEKKTTASAGIGSGMSGSSSACTR